MVTTKAQTRIIGLMLGEAALNRINPGIPPLTASFALVRDDNELAGRVEKRMEWSQKTMDLLQALQDSMERDMLEALFIDPESADSGGEPQQV